MCENIGMRITSTTNYYHPSSKSLKLRQAKGVVQKTANSIKKSDFLTTPLKYSAIGLIMPIPFASPIGFVIGLGVALYKKLLMSNKN